MSFTERGSCSYWDLESDGPENVCYKSFSKHQPEPGVAKLKELISTQDLALLDLHERERQLIAREAAAIRLEEHGRQQELAAREAALLGREAALAIKERELNLGEREQAVREAEAKQQEQEFKLNTDICKLKELENEFYKKSQEQCRLLSEQEREIFAKEEYLRQKEKDLEIEKKLLEEQKKDIDILLQTLKQKEESMETKLSELEVWAENLKSREKNFSEKEVKFFESLEQAKLEEENVRKEFELTKTTLDEKARQLKTLENSITTQERDLENKRSEIQLELAKQDAILKDTANIISEKEKQFQNLERETLERIAAQENELKLWEQELQQQEIKIQSHKLSLEQHNAEIEGKEKNIFEQNAHLSQWQNQLHARAKTLQQQAEAQEEHLRVILEKEKLFEELRITLEQKEQQYKMLVQCREHDFEIREQNLQKIICDLLHHDSKEDRMRCPNLRTFSSTIPPLISTNDNSLPSKFNREEYIYKSEKGIPFKQTPDKGEFNKCLGEATNSKITLSHSAENISISKQALDKRQLCFSECCKKKGINIDVESISPANVNKDQNSAMNNQTAKTGTVGRDASQRVISIQKSSPRSSPANKDFALTRRQIQLLEQIKSDRCTGQSTVTSMNCASIISDKKNEYISSFDQELQIRPPCTDYKESNFKLFHEKIKKNNNISSESVFEIPCKLPSSHEQNILPKDNNESNQFHSLCTQTSKSGSLENLSDEIHLQLNQQNTLQGAARCHRMELVRSLLEHHGADIDGRDSEGCTALHWAAQLGHIALVKYLGSEMGASVDAQNEIGRTALHLAALEGRLDVVQYLVGHLGADIEARDFYGETALHLAAGAGWLEIVKYLSSVKGSRIPKTDISHHVPTICIEECP